MNVIRRLDPCGPHWADKLPIRYPMDYSDRLAIREAERIKREAEMIR